MVTPSTRPLLACAGLAQLLLNQLQVNLGLLVLHLGLRKTLHAFLSEGDLLPPAILRIHYLMREKSHRTFLPLDSETRNLRRFWFLESNDEEMQWDFSLIM